MNPQRARAGAKQPIWPDTKRFGAEATTGNKWQCPSVMSTSGGYRTHAKTASARPPKGAGLFLFSRTVAGGTGRASGTLSAFAHRGQNEEEATMPVILLWAVPAVIVVGGVGYYLVRAVH